MSFTEYRHTSGENRLLLRAHDGRGLDKQQLKSQFTDRQRRRLNDKPLRDPLADI
jgi:hypothetical protein